MDFEHGGPVIKVLLLTGGQSSRMGSRKELLPFPDGKLAIEHAVETLHSAVPSATTIYISLNSEAQVDGIKPILEAYSKAEPFKEPGHYHESLPLKLQLIFDEQVDIGPAAGILAAHNLHPESKWLVLSCNYPLLPASAIQQLLLEYTPTVTCLVQDSGIAEPLLSIWDSEAIGRLERNLYYDGNNGKDCLVKVVEQLGGKLVKPLRDEWITRTNTKKEWDDAMSFISERDS